MKISVIIPVYNGSRYLKQAMQSVLLQPYKDIELICVDDGSTDDSLSIIKALSCNDDRIVVVSKENGGVGSARNCGIDLAKGEYIAFLDQDDVWVKNTLTVDIIDEIKENQLEMISFSMYASNQNMSRVSIVPEKDRVIIENTELVSMKHHSSFFFNRAFLKENQIYIDRYHGIDYNYRNEDVRFLLECFRSNGSCMCFAKPIFIYRNNKSSETHDRKNARYVLESSIEGYVQKAKNTSNLRLQSACKYYTTRLFIELMETVSLVSERESIAKQQYERFQIESLLLEGYVSDYSRPYYNKWKTDPNHFWAIMQTRARYKILRLAVSSVPIMREIYHIRKYCQKAEGLLYDQV